jgi:predicted secreted protein
MYALVHLAVRVQGVLMPATSREEKNEYTQRLARLATHARDLLF